MKPSLPSIRLHLAYTLDENNEISLEQKQAHYLTHVMRRKVGDQILAFNSDNGEWLAEITEVKKKSATLHIVEQTRSPASSPDCWLVCTPLKSGHLEFMIEKATELGAREIHTVKTQHMAIKRINAERLSAIAIEAAEQCERLDVPSIYELTEFRQLLADWPSDRPLFYGDESGHAEPFHKAVESFCHPRAGGDLTAVSSKEDSHSRSSLRSGSRLRGDDNIIQKWAVMVGPEGGFSHTELELLRSHKNTIGVSLGPRILRADTASTTLLALTQSLFGDWGKKPSFRSGEPVTPSS